VQIKLFGLLLAVPCHMRIDAHIEAATCASSSRGVASRQQMRTRAVCMFMHQPRNRERALMPHIGRQRQHDVAVPWPDASSRTSTQRPAESSGLPSHAGSAEGQPRGYEHRRHDAVWAGSSGRTRAVPPIWASSRSPDRPVLARITVRSAGTADRCRRIGRLGGCSSAGLAVGVASCVDSPSSAGHTRAGQG
jgi:hypothetical protein